MKAGRNNQKNNNGDGSDLLQLARTFCGVVNCQGQGNQGAGLTHENMVPWFDNDIGGGKT